MNRPGKIERRRAIMALLIEAFPGAFDSGPRPLMVGTYHAIVAALPGVRTGDLRQALGMHCHRTAYLRELIAGAPRYDLQGAPAGVVTPAEAATAAEEIIEAEPRRAAKMAAAWAAALARRAEARAARKARAGIKTAAPPKPPPSPPPSPARECGVRVHQDPASWEAGRRDGAAGKPSRCPTGADDLSYASGFVEGRAERVSPKPSSPPRESSTPRLGLADLKAAAARRKATLSEGERS
jgi:ProP effector